MFVAAWGVLVAAAKLVYLVWRFAYLAPWTALVVAVAAGLYVWAGVEALTSAAFAVVMTLVIWRWHYPVSYRRLVGCWWGCWWRRWLIYQWLWTWVAARHGLAATLVDPETGGSYTDRRRLVKLRRVRTATGMDRLLLRLPVGLEPDDVQRATVSLAHAFRARAARVRAYTRPGLVWLELRRRDTLARTVAPLPIPPMRTTEEAVEVLAGVPVGLREDGTVWRLALRLVGLHLLIAGATGAGKGSVLWSLIRGLADGIRHGLVEVIVFDPKGGQSFPYGRHLFAALHTGRPETMADALEDLVVVMWRRQTDLTDGLVPSEDDGAMHLPAPGSPHLVVVIDELITLTALAESRVAKRIEAALGLLLTQGRSAGISVVAALQDPGKDVIRQRNLFPTRVAMRLDEPLQADMVLGDGMRAMGAECDLIPQATPGVAFVKVHGEGGTTEPVRVRASHVTAADLADLPGRQALTLVPVLEGGAVEDDQDEADDRSTHEGDEDSTPPAAAA